MGDHFAPRTFAATAMTSELGSGARCLLFDVEGTITSLSFVKDELIPYARKALLGFLQTHARRPAVQDIFDRLVVEIGTRDRRSIARTLQRWIDEDRKHPDLKALQGLIWEEGYRSGAFRGHLYSDVVPFWERQRAAGRLLAIYSSGSAYAQRLLLQHSVCGDVAHLIDRHFDTQAGAKGEAASYTRIASALDVATPELRFFSDVVSELDAARAAGLQTCRVVRPGVPVVHHSHPEIGDFTDTGLEDLG